jgi:hypothetical protein
MVPDVMRLKFEMSQFKLRLPEDIFFLKKPEPIYRYLKIKHKPDGVC